jgi:phosphoglycolate phosphatase-like HAD superfamily hydrolase
MIVPIFDFDGTLVDSDQELAGAFVALGVPKEDVTFGHELAVECDRLGVSVEDYVEVYRTFRPQPFPQVEELLHRLDVWHICSNKHGPDGHRELERLGWSPSSAWFSDAFSGPKSLRPLLAAHDLDPADVVFIGDTDHDRACADDVGCPFVLAGWNPRALASHHQTDLVANAPVELLGLFATLGG